MKKFIYFTLLMLAVVITHAQENDNRRILKIAGHAQTKVPPDLGVLRINVTNIDMAASQAITGLNNKTQEVFRELNKIGFKEADIKTVNFQINENRVYRHNESKDSGFVAMQTVEVEFENKKERISQILTTFSNTKTNFNIGFQFKLSDNYEKEVKNKLIAEAIEDAKNRAKLIADNAGVKLNQIEEIIYGININENYPVSYGMASSVAKSGEISGFTPQDIQMKDKVIIHWSIE